MSSIWGNKIKVSVFGESHGAAIGATIDGLPSGVSVDQEAVAFEMKRRAASSSRLATPRKEADEVEIVSGFFEGKTTGTPLTGIIRNGNTRSKDYARTKDLMRPGHADYSGWVRYSGFQDYREAAIFQDGLQPPLFLPALSLRLRWLRSLPRLKSAAGFYPSAVSGIKKI